MMPAPGKKKTHHAPLVKYRYESASIAPHSGVGGCAPSPRNPSAAASRIANAIESVVCTIRGGKLFGTMWRSEERRVGKEGRSRWSQDFSKKKGEQCTVVACAKRRITCSHCDSACVKFAVIDPTDS